MTKQEFLDRAREKHGYKPTDDAWVLNKIDCLREPIRTMIPADKAKVVQYMQNLKKLSLLYVSLKQNKHISSKKS